MHTTWKDVAIELFAPGTWVEIILIVVMMWCWIGLAAGVFG